MVDIDGLSYGFLPKFVIRLNGNVVEWIRS